MKHGESLTISYYIEGASQQQFLSVLMAADARLAIIFGGGGGRGRVDAPAI